MRYRRLIALLAIALVALALIPACKSKGEGGKGGEDYVEDLFDRQKDAERAEDQTLARQLSNATELVALDIGSKLNEGQFIADPWMYLKEQVDPQARSYLEGLSSSDYSDKNLSASIAKGGWIKVRQGWITVETAKNAYFSFTFTETQP